MTEPPARIIRYLEAEMMRATSRTYEVNLAALDYKSLTELRRFLQDVDQEKRTYARRAQLHPWRKP